MAKSLKLGPAGASSMAGNYIGTGIFAQEHVTYPSSRTFPTTCLGKHFGARLLGRPDI